LKNKLDYNLIDRTKAFLENGGFNSEKGEIEKEN
jgi:hypothetical protein